MDRTGQNIDGGNMTILTTLLFAAILAAIFIASAHAAIESKQPLLAVPALILVVVFVLVVLAAGHMGGLS